MKPKDSLAAAKKRGKEMTRKILRDPRCKLISLGAETSRREIIMAIFGKKMNLRKSWLNKYIFVKFKGEIMMPSWQTEPEVEPHLQKIIEILESKGLGALGMLTFFMNGNKRLGSKSPLDALRENKVKEVLAVARCYHEHGAA